jgi:hypothetical protein
LTSVGEVGRLDGDGTAGDEVSAVSSGVLVPVDSSVDVGVRSALVVGALSVGVPGAVVVGSEVGVRVGAVVVGAGCPLPVSETVGAGGGWSGGRTWR